MSSPMKTWTRFTKNRNGEELRLQIQELPKDKMEEMFDFLFKYFVPEEPLHKASKISQRSEALEQYKQAFMMMSKELDYQIDACYVDDGSEDLQMVGLSIMVLEKKVKPCDDLETVKAMVESEEIKTLLNLSTFLDDACKIFEKFSVDSCYKGRGVVVHRDYRNLGIAGELFNVRTLICKERGVPLTSAWMTSIGTQKAATKLGWETICEVDYKDLGKELGVEFEEELSSAKLMIIKV